jgi:GNAT superfamily N-acetyltransferase
MPIAGERAPMPKKYEPKMLVRRAERQDIATLVEMRMALLKEVGNVHGKTEGKDLMGAIRRYFHRELKAGRYVGFIGKIRGQAVACGGLAFYARPPYRGNLSGKEAYLMGMYTAVDWRRKGLGRRMLRKILAFAKARRVGRVWLHSEPGAISLYDRVGFRSNDSYRETIW